MEMRVMSPRKYGSVLDDEPSDLPQKQKGQNSKYFA